MASLYVVQAVRSGELTLQQAARRGGTVADIRRRVWQTVKQEVLARDGACVHCAEDNTILDVHHRDASGMGGTGVAEIAWGMANLIVLCRKHHDYFEQNPDRARAFGYRVDTGQTPSQIPVYRFGMLVLLDNDGDWKLAAA